METVIGSEFTLLLSECPCGGPLEKKSQREIIVVPSGSFPHGPDISPFLIHKIINCSIGLLFPVIRGNALGTESRTEITLLTQPTEIVLNDVSLVGINRLLNPGRGRSSLHGILTIGNCITNESNMFIALDLSIQFFMQGIKIGKARHEIYRSSQYSLRA